MIVDRASREFPVLEYFSVKKKTQILAYFMENIETFEYMIIVIDDSLQF